MEAVGCTAAALSLGQLCLTTVHRLHTLLEKYRNTPQTIAALHTEIVAIGASMWYIKMILENTPELESSRFCGDPGLADMFFHALSGCRLVLVSVQNQVSSFIEGIDQKGSTARKAKRKYLWKEATLKELLHTVRGQNAAISSIIQCLQLENSTDLTARVDKLRVTLSQSQDAPGQVDAEHQNEATSSHPQPQDPNFSRASFRESEQHTNPATEWKAANSNSSLAGLAPSTIMGGKEEANPHEISPLDDLLERHSAISGISISSLAQRWLESQLDPEQARRTFSKVKDVAASVTDGGNQGDSFTLQAPDTETFLENIRYFMPQVSDFSTERSSAGKADGEREVNTTMDFATETCSMEENSMWSGLEDSPSLLTVPDHPESTAHAENTALVQAGEAIAATKGLSNALKDVEIHEPEHTEPLTSHVSAQQSDPSDQLQPPTTDIQPNHQPATPPAQQPESQREAENVPTSPSKRLPTIPPMYTERHSWEHSGEVPLRFQQQPMLRRNYRFSQALVTGTAPRNARQARSPVEEVPSLERKRRQLPSVIAQRVYGYGDI